MSKSKKKKFIPMKVEFAQEETMLPTKAVHIERRPYNNRNRDSYNKREDSRPFDSRWRSGGSGADGNKNSSQSRSQSRSSGGFGGSFRNNNRERPQYSSNRNTENNTKTESDMGNWRTNQTKAQPTMQRNITTALNSNRNHSNSDPWRSNNNNGSAHRFGGGSGGSGGMGGGRRFGGNRDAQNSANSSFSSRPRNTFSPNNKFAQKSSSGGFGASVLGAMDNGTTRLTYGNSPTANSNANSRFGGLRNSANNNNNIGKAPAKISSSRFAPSVPKPQTNEYPQLKSEKPKPLSPENNRFSKSKSQSQSQSPKPPMKPINNKNNAKSNKANEKNDNKNKPKKVNKTNQSNNNSKNSTANATPNANSKKNNNGCQKTAKKKENKHNEIDKKLRKKLGIKWKKNYINGSKAVPINADTDKLLICGLDQANLLNTGDNYEKIAKVVAHLILDKSNKYSLNCIFDILFNKTSLTNPDCGVSSKKFLSLILEILSDIEEGSSCLALLTMYVGQSIEEKYIVQLSSLRSKFVQTEFSEYGLEYIYPCPLQNKENWTDLAHILSELQKYKNDSECLIYSNHETMNDILSWILDNYYFKKWSNDVDDTSDSKDGDDDNLAKELCGSLENGAFAEIIKLLVYPSDDDDDEEDDDDDEDSRYSEINNSNYIVMLSRVISISTRYECWKNGALLCLLKQMHAANMFMTEHVLAFQQDSREKFTENRLSALSKLADWVSQLDEMKARLDAQRDNEQELDSDEDQQANSYVGASLLSKPKHKSAADYETISYVEIN